MPEMPAKNCRQLSFRIGTLLPLEDEFKQLLLTPRSEEEQPHEIKRVLEEMIPALHLAIRARQKAGGNGRLRRHE